MTKRLVGAVGTSSAACPRRGGRVFASTATAASMRHPVTSRPSRPPSRRRKKTLAKWWGVLFILPLPITPVFGYSPPHPGAGGTSTLLTSALPGAHYGPLRHPARPDLTLAGCRLARATPPPGLPVLRPFPSSMRAVATTPAESVGACVARFPTHASLPRQLGESASASIVSRPARRSLALPPAWSLGRPRRPFVIRVLQPMSLPPSSAPTATGWSDSCRAGFAPAEEWRLRTAHQLIGIWPSATSRCSL